MYKLGPASLSRLGGVHSDLQNVVKRAIELTTVDFTVLEGLRTLERQKQLYAAGKSQTMHSRHLDGHAVDLGAWVNNKVDWWLPLYAQIAQAMKDAAQELQTPIEWGGDWRTFKDSPHFQLPWAQYP